MTNDPGHCNILFCRSALAYRDVGEGRKQDAEASPVSVTPGMAQASLSTASRSHLLLPSCDTCTSLYIVAARRRSCRSVSDLSKCELDIQSYPVNQKLSKQILLLIVRGEAVTGVAYSLNKAVMPGRFE